MLSVRDERVLQPLNIYADPGFEIGAEEATDHHIQVVPRHPERWGILLAGGDGSPMQSLTMFISGDERPKQFCAVVGTETLFQQACRRASRSIAPEQTIVALTRSHSRYYSPALAGSSYKRMVQPCNRGTAPAIIASLLHISQMNPGALVAILPSDHYYSDEAAFSKTLEAAFKIADVRRSAVVLLGALPHAPEVEFGWIEVGARLEEGLCEVGGFHEKPTLDTAKRLLVSGALWSTFIAVGCVETLIDMAFASVPEVVVTLFDGLGGATRDGSPRILATLYNSIPVIDFSREILSPNSHRLLALRLAPMEWHDLGQPDRVVAVVRSKNPIAPAWVHAWEAARRSLRTAQAI
jgi:mannose-1-phosphate guanylyltransferase